MAEQLLATLNSIDLNQRGLRAALTGFAAVGTMYLGMNTWAVLRGFFKYCFAYRLDLKKRYGGGWALVTGASDGIGRAYCNELARSGLDIILMARNQEKLDAAAKELREAHKVQTRTIVYDFSQLSTQESAEELQALLDGALKDLDVSILVNNVGCAKFASLDQHSIWDSMRMINVNINSQTYMSMFLLPRLLKRESRSAVINVSSVAAYSPGGMVPVYSATKAYNFALSTAMQDQFGDKLDVLTVTPASVKTLMNSGRYCFSVTAETHARATIDQLGWVDRTRGAALHALQPRLKSIYPVGWLVDKVNGRRRAQLRKEEDAKAAGKELQRSKTCMTEMPSQKGDDG